MSRFVNFSPAVRSNKDAEDALASEPVKSYVAWRVPFDEDQFRVSYVTEEGSLAAPRRVYKHIDVTYLPENGCYIMVSQINPTMYPTLYDLLKERAYLDINHKVANTVHRSEPEKTSVQLSMDPVSAVEAATARLRKKVTSSSSALARSSAPKHESNSKTRKVFKFLRSITPPFVDKSVWLWDRLPTQLLIAFGFGLLAVQLSFAMWTHDVRDEVFAERDRLDMMTERGLNTLISDFHRAVDVQCKEGGAAWRDHLASFHDQLETEFNTSAAAVGVFRISVSYLVCLASLMLLAWIGFPCTQLEYQDELLSLSTSAEAERVAEEMQTGVSRARGKRDARGVGTGTGGKRGSTLSLVAGVDPTKLWWIVVAGTWLCAVYNIVVGYQYYNVPETVSQQFEDTFLNLQPEAYSHIPACRTMLQSAMEAYYHSPHILTLVLRDEEPGSGCLFGGEPVPKLSQWVVDRHGDLPLFHCNSIIMPSTVGFARLTLLAVAALLVGNILTLFLRDVVCDVTMVGWKDKKRD